MIAMESSSLVLRPNIIVPRKSWLTLTPVRPRLRYSITGDQRARRASAADEVALADLDAVVAQDRVRRHVVEVEVRHGEVQQIVLAVEGHRAVRKLELDRARLRTVELRRLERLQ